MAALRRPRFFASGVVLLTVAVLLYAALQLTAEQWAFIKGTSNLARHLKLGVLVKRGQEAVYLDADLSGLGPLLKLYRSGTEPVRLVERLQREYGMDGWVGQYVDFG